jgi:hypothetical protein
MLLKKAKMNLSKFLPARTRSKSSEPFRRQTTVKSVADLLVRA